MDASQSDTLENHYTSEDLSNAIFAGLKKAGKDLNNLKQEDLAPVDEFHTLGVLVW